MLALAVFFLAADVPQQGVVLAGPSPMPSPTARPTPRPQPTPSPSPSPTTCIRTAVLEKNVLTVPGRGGQRPSDSALIAAFRRFETGQVGLLLTYGHGRTTSAGVQLAGTVNTLLRRVFPTAITRQTITEDFFNSAGPIGTVTFDVYLLAADCI